MTAGYCNTVFRVIQYPYTRNKLTSALWPTLMIMSNYTGNLTNMTIDALTWISNN